MGRVLGYLLLLTTLFAQSAWAFEGHPGHFEAGSHGEQPAHAPVDHSDEGVGHHCVHSPVHFFAVHRGPVDLAAVTGRAEPPPYRAPTSSRYAEPPTQPPRG